MLSSSHGVSHGRGPGISGKGVVVQLFISYGDEVSVMFVSTNPAQVILCAALCCLLEPLHHLCKAMSRDKALSPLEHQTGKVNLFIALRRGKVERNRAFG